MEALLLFYKRALSPLLHAAGGGSLHCRFQPTCSEYAAIAMAAHGPWRGGWLTARRLLRCHPLGKGGFDPVPSVLRSSGGACADPIHLP